MRRFLSLLALAAAATASPVQQRQASPVPTVTTNYSTVVGSSDGTVDSFMGVPFAQPPVGPLRLKPPQPITSSLGLVQATGVPMACPQFYGQINTTGLTATEAGELSTFQPASQQAASGENCLTLVIQRPTGTNSSAKLPILFFMYGGGFESGSTQEANGEAIVQQSISENQPIIYVAVNYRLGAFGWLAGSQLQKDGSTNLGLRDQRLGMQWVADNIAAFGGDPSKVTIWGESAGSWSTFDHTVINRGDNTYKGKPLFRAAMMDSGTIFPSLDVSTPVPQGIFNDVATAAGCDPSSSTVLTCLRNAPYETFLSASNSVPNFFGYRSLNIAYQPRPDPSSNFYPQSGDILAAEGQFAKVPVIAGDQMDEGTLFVLSLANVTSQQQLTTYIQSYFPLASQQQVQSFVSTYPDDPSAGSPFNTGSANELYPNFKRNAALLGDLEFTLARRLYLYNLTARGVKAWSYLYNSYAGTPYLGTFHVTDLFNIFFNVEPSVGQAQRTYYLNFINNLNPNTGAAIQSPLIQWPEWSPSSPQLLEFNNGSNTLTPDNFREQSFAQLVANFPVFRQ